MSPWLYGLDEYDEDDFGGDPKVTTKTRPIASPGKLRQKSIDSGSKFLTDLPSFKRNGFEYKVGETLWCGGSSSRKITRIASNPNTAFGDSGDILYVFLEDGSYITGDTKNGIKYSP